MHRRDEPLVELFVSEGVVAERLTCPQQSAA